MAVKSLGQWLRDALDSICASQVPDSEDVLPTEYCGVCNEGPEACNTCPYLQDM